MGIDVALGGSIVLLGIALLLLPAAALRQWKGGLGAERRYRVLLWSSLGLLGAMLGLAWLNAWILQSWRMHIPLPAAGQGPQTLTVDPGAPMDLWMDWTEGVDSERFLRSLSWVMPSGEREPLFPEDDVPSPIFIRTPATLSYVLGTPGEVAAARRTTLMLTRRREAQDAGFLFGVLQVGSLVALLWILIWHKV